MNIDYALYTEYIDDERDNDTAHWYTTRDAAIAAAREYIASGTNPDDIGIMAFIHNGDCMWDAEIQFDASGACWCDDLSAWDNYDAEGNVISRDIIA